MGDVGAAVQRAQHKTEQLQARAGALDELMASDALEDATAPVAHDELQGRLDAITAAGDGQADTPSLDPAATEPKPAPAVDPVDTDQSGGGSAER